jgi:hypothetical protein
MSGGTPVLWRRGDIPRALGISSTEVNAGFYAGDVRLGSLREQGTVDFLVYRSLGDAHDGGGMKPCFLGAFDVDGQVLWQQGEGGTQPSRPGPVTLYDIDNDGRDEVVCFFKDASRIAESTSLADVVLQIRCGSSGEVIHQAAPKAITECSGEGPNWVHQRLLVANLRGADRPTDLIVKIGDRIVALDDQFNTLWTYTSPWTEYGHCPAYIPSIGDIDRDGHDEVNGGYFLLDHDGTVIWEDDLAPHMDSVAITEWDGGHQRAICSGSGHVLDATGSPILSLGETVVPHGQEVRVARFDANDPSPQMVIRWNGHNTDSVVADTQGDVVNRFNLNASPNNTGMEVVYWEGPDEPARLCMADRLWNPITGHAVGLPGVAEVNPIGRMAWYHCIPANVCGDQREEVILYNPWSPEIWIFTQEDSDGKAFTGYRPGSRQYNVRLMD